MKFTVAVILLLVGVAMCQEPDTDGTNEISLRNIFGPLARGLRVTGEKLGQLGVDIKNGDATSFTNTLGDGLLAAFRGLAESINNIFPRLGSKLFAILKIIIEILRDFFVTVPAAAVDKITGPLVESKFFGRGR